jgi:tRNA nucleotidyltransferase (CCA-adding enzyme)
METLRWYRMTYLEETPCPWILYYYALNAGLSHEVASENYTSLGLPESRKEATLKDRAHHRTAGHRLKKWQEARDAGQAKVSEGCALLDPFTLESLLFLMSVGDDPALQRNVSKYLTKWRGARADVNGEDLLAMGLAPGPLFRRIIQDVLVAKRDGIVSSRESQLELAQRLVRETGEMSGPG